MKRVLTIVFALIPLMSSAQDERRLERFYDSLSGSCVQLEYTYSARVSGIMNNGEGVLVNQGPMWTVKGNGVEMYCDSATLWVLDPVLKEVVIEPAAAEASSEFLDNPAIMFSRLKNEFVVSESRWMEGGDTRLYTLKPKTHMGIDYFNVELDKDTAFVRRASFALADGTLVKIEVSSMKLTPKISVEAFRPETVFDVEWIVTDLR